MALLQMLVKRSLTFSNAVLHTIIRTHPCVSTRFVGALTSTCVLEPRDTRPRINVPCLDEQELDLFGYVQDDLKVFQHNIKETLGQFISNKEMYNIATHLYTGKKEDQSGLWIIMPMLIGKALNYHLGGDGTLTHSQSKVVMIMDLLMSTILLHDDVVDNSKTRRGIPSANVVWYPYKSIVVGNMIYAICLSEARKLNNPDITSSICEGHETCCRGQYMQYQVVTKGEDRMTRFLTKTECKSGGAAAYGLKAMSLAVGASDVMTDVVVRYSRSIFTTMQLVDDLMDLEIDLKEGVATAPVIFASREHPVLEEMISRNFQQDGDVEKAMELVRQSRGLEQATDLAGRYCSDAMRYAQYLAVSPYQRMLESLANYYQYRLESGTDKQEQDDWFY